jgi:hypothetical protein
LVSPEIEFLRFESDVYAGVVVSEIRGQLHIQRRGRQPVPIFFNGDNRFRFARDSGSSIEFSRAPDGRQVVVFRGGTFEKESATWSMARRWLLEIAVLLLLVSVTVPIGLLLANERSAAKLCGWQAVSALALLGMSYAFNVARAAGALGGRNLATTTVWLLSWTFVATAYAGFQRAVGDITSRAAPRIVRIYALVTALAAVWIALHLARYGLIGLKTWRW